MKKFLLIGIFLLIAYVGFSQEESFKYEDHSRRDPLWPLINAQGVVVQYGEDLQLSDMVLEGIMRGNDNQSLAIINGKIIKPKDKIGPYIVISIAGNEVKLQKGEEISVLKLKKED